MKLRSANYWRIRRILSDVPVVVTRTAARRPTDQLPETVAAACAEFLFGPLADNPCRVGAALRSLFAGQWRACRGQYRVRYRIDDQEQVVYVLDIDHRRDADH